LSIFSGPGVAPSLREALGQARTAELRVGLMGSLIDLGAPPSLAEALADLSGRRASDSLLYLPLIARLVAGDPKTALRAFGDEAVTGDARIILAEALGASGDYRALGPLCIAARAPDEELRIASIRGLKVLAHPGAEAVILEALADPVWVVRAAACGAAGRIGLPQAVPRLAGLLEDPVWWVRFRAGEALTALGDVGRERLALVAATGGDLSRRTAAIILAELGPPAEVV
jgi:HEAT repeat protein